MSSMSLHTNRKRLYSPDFRDSDSEDELPPYKLMRQSGSEIPEAIAGKLRNLFLWISDLPVKNFFTMAVKSGSKLANETIVLDDEDEDEEISIQAVDKGVVDRSKLNSLIERYETPHKMFSSNSASSRRHSDLNVSISISPRYDSHKANGSSSRDWNPRYENGSCFSRQSRTDNLKRPAIISNPNTDVEILLGAKTDVPTPEADDIEILSESPSTKQKHVSSHKSHRLSRLSALRHSTPIVHHSKNEAPSVKRSQSQSQSSQNFTANEVVRLQEKAQYKLLLEKYMSEPYYHHIAKKQHTDVGIQADSNLFSGSHFKKEVLQQPVDNFVEKFYRPCRLLPPDDGKQSSEKKEPLEIKIDDDEDDDLQILEVKLPEKRSQVRCMKYFTPEWISELKSSLQETTKERMEILADQERKLEKYTKERLLNRLRVEVPEPVEPEFPELTPEMEEAVETALMPGRPDDPIRKNNPDYLVRKDIETLGGLNWLNDRVINTYFELIVERSKQEGYPSIHAFNTFFYGKLKQQGYDSIKRWTRKIDLFSFDLIFVPIHLTVHWCLAVIDNRSKKICYYDSMGTGEEQCLDLLHEYIMLEHKNKKGQELDPSSYVTEIMKEIPQQMNGSDCGMFTVKYAEYISRDAEITFNQGHMQYFRRRMVYELLNSQLL